VIASFCLATTRYYLVEAVPGENGPICTFESSAGERFTLARPAMTARQEAAVKEMLREILKDEGWL
jgi:hypothetical protein